MSNNREPSGRAGMSRRAFLQASGSVAGSAWLALHTPAVLAAARAAAVARETGAAFQNLSPAQAAGLEALTARIIPTDDTPGAREAGVVFFIDQALGGFMADSAGMLLQGMEALDAAALDAGGAPFAALGPESQDALLRGIEDTDFFGLAHYLTIAGMFALPSYGGNRDYLGWKLIGFDHRHGWAPPFGHYDAEQAGSPAPQAAPAKGHGHG